MKKERHFLVIILAILIVICGKVVVSPQCVRAENNGLLVFYSFGEPYGTTVLDSSGNNYHGILTGASRVEGKVGGGLLFSADYNARVFITDFLEFNDGLITVEAWIKPYRIENGETYRILGDTGDNGVYFQIRDGMLEVCYEGLSYHYGITPIQVGVWTRVVFTSDGRHITTYINSVLDKISNITLPLRVIGNVTVGARNIYTGGDPLFDWVEEFPGIIDEFKIWNRSDTSSPVISGSSRTITKPNEFYSFTPTASDLYSDALTFSISGKPSWVTFSTTSGMLSGTPSTADIGRYGPITITVRDPDGNTDSLSPFFLRVTDRTPLPGVYLLFQKE